MLADHKQIDKRTAMKNQNRSASLGWPAMKLLGGGGGGRGFNESTESISSRRQTVKTLFRRHIRQPNLVCKDCLHVCP